MVYALHLTALLEMDGVTSDTFKTMYPEHKAPFQSKAIKTSKGAYLACVFLLMTDKERYGKINRYSTSTNVPEKSSKKKLKEFVWGM